MEHYRVYGSFNPGGCYKFFKLKNLLSSGNKSWGKIHNILILDRDTTTLCRHIFISKLKSSCMVQTFLPPIEESPPLYLFQCSPFNSNVPYILIRGLFLNHENRNVFCLIFFLLQQEGYHRWLAQKVWLSGPQTFKQTSKNWGNRN